MKTSFFGFGTGTKRLVARMLCVLGMAGVSHCALGALIAYEGFNYTVGSQAVGRSGVVTDWNGGTGWAGPWEDIPPDPNALDPYINPASSTDLAVSDIVAGSLSYTDAGGRVLMTSGNMLHNSGLVATSRPARNLAAHVITNGTTTWISFVGQRTGGLGSGGFYDRGANLSLFNTNVWGTNVNGRLAVGESSGTAAGQPNDTWGVVPIGLGSIRRQSPYGFTNVALVVIRIDHRDDNDPLNVAATNEFDDMYFWLNPTNLAVEPGISIAITNILSTETNAAGVPAGFDLAFNRIVMFAGNPNAANAAAEWLFDELRIGDTYADVVPFVIPPVWTSIVPSGGGMALTLSGTPNGQYTIETTADLNPPSWTSNGNLTLSPGGTGVFTDSGLVSTNQQRYYRAKEQ